MLVSTLHRCSRPGRKLVRTLANELSSDREWQIEPSGLSFQDIRIGTGSQPVAGERVVVHYSSMVEETEKLLESTYQVAYPVEFHLDDGHVLPGLNDGVRTMREGGRRLLVVPPAMGYGRFSDPPNVTLIMDVELLEVGPPKSLWQRLQRFFRS